MDRLLGRLRRFRRLFILIAVVGPGLITTNAGNDAGAIATYSQAGAEFGFRMLWILVVITVSLAVFQEMIWPRPVASVGYFLLAIGLIGTTIAPWMLFFLQSSVAEKGIPNEQLPYARADAISGAIFADLVAFFIIVAAAAAIHGALPPDRLANMQAADYARALQPAVGQAAFVLFGVGLFGASLLSAGVVP